MWRSRWRGVIKPAYSVYFLLSINIFVWQNVLYFPNNPRIIVVFFLFKWLCWMVTLLSALALDGLPLNTYISLYARTNVRYNERGSRSNYVRCSITHCTIWKYILLYLPTILGLMFLIAIFSSLCLEFSIYVSILSQEQLISTVYLTELQFHRIFDSSFLLRVQIY